MSLLKISELTKTINLENILEKINIELTEGKIYGFVGRNGSGKSILFKTICGFIRPTSGDVFVNGINIYETDSFPKNTRALIEKPKFLTHLTGYENLELLASIEKRIGKKEIDETLEKVNLLDNGNKMYGIYSLGMKQKLGIAQVLMENPKIILLDEPFNGLDEKSAKKIRELLIEEKKNGKLILIATHIKDDIEILCDEVFYMDYGKIVNHEVLK